MWPKNAQHSEGSFGDTHRCPFLILMLRSLFLAVFVARTPVQVETSNLLIKHDLSLCIRNPFNKFSFQT